MIKAYPLNSVDITMYRLQIFLISVKAICSTFPFSPPTVTGTFQISIMLFLKHLIFLSSSCISLFIIVSLLEMLSQFFFCNPIQLFLFKFKSNVKFSLKQESCSQQAKLNFTPFGSYLDCGEFNPTLSLAYISNNHDNFYLSIYCGLEVFFSNYCQSI